MKILVTGGAGYIGSHVVLDLLEKGHEVVVIDDMSKGREENIHSEVMFILGSTLDDDKLKLVLSDDIDAVIHLAALKAAGESMTHPEKYSINNIAGTLSLLNAMTETNVKRIVFSSTAAVYGYPKYLPIDEEHPTVPINYYGYTKLSIEQYLSWYSKLKGVHFAALRYFNAAGYDQLGRVLGLEIEPANLLPIVMEVACGKRKKLKVFGNNYDTADGTGIRDYIHVTDLAMAHTKALDYIQTNERLTINLASGESHSVLDVVDMAQKVTGKEIPYKIVNTRPGDAAELVANPTFAKKILDWDPIHSGLEELLSSMWKVYQQNFDKVDLFV